MTTYKVCSKCNCAVLTDKLKEHLAKHRQKPQINSDLNSQEISKSVADDVFFMCTNCKKKIKMQYLASHKKICQKVLDVKVQAILNRIQKASVW